MPITAAQYAVVISADTSGAEKGMASVNEKAQATHGLLGQLASGALGAFAGFSAANIAGDAVGFLKDQLVESFQAGMNANDIMAQTVAGLKSTRDASGMTAQGIGDLATHLMNLSGIQDDAVQTGENMLLTFTNIGKNVFPQATQAAADMATKMNGGMIPSAQQLQQQSLQLGKALNDPLKGITALTREGVTFSDQQKKNITAMMKHGDVAGAQAVILKELNKEFGGSAAAAGKANGGIAIMTAQLDNAKQTIGQAMIPALTQMMTAIKPLVTSFAQNLPGAIAATQTFFHNLQPVMQAVEDAFAAIRSKLADFASFLVAHQPAMEALKSILLGIGAAVVVSLIPAAIALVPAFVAWAVAAATAAIATLAATWPILAVGLAIGALIFGIKELVSHWSQVEGFFGNLKGAIGNFFSMMGTKLHDLGAMFLNAGHDIIQKLIDGIKGMAGNLANTLGSTVHNAVAAIPGVSGHLPGFAGGGVMGASGFAIVGEHGPELMALPAGTQVYSHAQSATMLSGLAAGAFTGSRGVGAGAGGGSGTQPIILVLDGRAVARGLLPYHVREIRRATGIRVQ